MDSKVICLKFYKVLSFEFDEKYYIFFSGVLFNLINFYYRFWVFLCSDLFLCLFM